MSKRSAPSSPCEEYTKVKKLKLGPMNNDPRMPFQAYSFSPRMASESADEPPTAVCEGPVKELEQDQTVVEMVIEENESNMQSFKVESPEPESLKVETPAVESLEIDANMPSLKIESQSIELKDIPSLTPESLMAESEEVQLAEADSIMSEAPEEELTKPIETKETTNNEETKSTPKRKAGEGFIPWKPAQADAPLPELQPHWGIIPRPGTYERPSEPQPAARDSNGEIRPPLWEDRKGAVRLKRGDRFMNGYDQVQHMWLPLIDVRPKSAKNQQPRRRLKLYYFAHGLPQNWTSSDALNDINKALQEAVKANSNKEAPYSIAEREVLANIFAENPEISLLDAAELFNERAYPLTGSEEGRYPTGRFTESIQHEFRMYKSVYTAGKAPTATTKKEIPLDEHFKAWKAQKKSEKAQAKPPSQNDLTESPAPEKSEAKATKTKAEKAPKMSKTSGITKKQKSKKPTPAQQAALSEAMAARADATLKLIMEKDAEENRVKATEARATEDLEAAAEFENDARDAEAEAAEVIVPHGLATVAALMGTTPAEISASPSVPHAGLMPLAAIDHRWDALEKVVYGPRMNIPTVTEVTPDEFNCVSFDAAEVMSQDPVAESPVMADSYVEKAARTIEFDEDYDEDEEL
ncbi:hypothetical protein E8E13_011217 [Curvularia kusanoi]|uniref:Uncharacterized protein n=1 Tax=Curvularia kusanoi TaxID=90978 RepID=A0A9P4TJD2_CURKU|nr:hypothetical protein E8E13_011217 [Curvularia kusanoi]